MEEIRQTELKNKIYALADRTLKYFYSAMFTTYAVISYILICFYAFWLTDHHFISNNQQAFFLYPGAIIVLFIRMLIVSPKNFMGRFYELTRAKQSARLASKMYNALEGASSTRENFLSASAAVDIAPDNEEADTVSTVDNSKHVVVLVHGIRDHALWQLAIKDTLIERGFLVEPMNYGYFDLIRFLMPIKYFRITAIEEVLKQIRMVKNEHQDCKISIIAHSFGTYIVSNILTKAFDLRFSHVIFCGSVVQSQFPFEQVRERFKHKIMNEVGARDIWPAFAESVTRGYGSAGTFGFRRPHINDRWHSKANHGFFLTAEFCRKYWIPFLESSTVVAGDKNPPSPSLLVKSINIFKLKYIVSSLLLSACIYYGSPYIVTMYRAAMLSTGQHA